LGCGSLSGKSFFLFFSHIHVIICSIEIPLSDQADLSLTSSSYYIIITILIIISASWNHIDLIPAHFLLSIFLFGIEEIATQLEEPFTILPMQAFCDKIYNWCNEIVTFEPGDNGMPVYTNEGTPSVGPGTLISGEVNIR
jgi:predicted membrane chloride channel (bestrophin family)